MKSVWYIDQVEFRRLQEQVRDVSMNLKNKFRTSAYQVLNILFIYSSTVQTYKFKIMNLRYKRLGMARALKFYQSQFNTVNALCMDISPWLSFC